MDLWKITAFVRRPLSIRNAFHAEYISFRHCHGMLLFCSSYNLPLMYRGILTPRQEGKMVDNYQLNSLPFYWDTKCYLYLRNEETKTKRFQQCDQPDELWAVAAKREKTWTFSFLLKPIPLEPRRGTKEAETVPWTSLPSHFTHHDWLSWAGKNKKGKCKRNYKISVEERGKRELA